MLPKIDDNKFALITGASSDMGFAIADKLKNSCNLLISGRDHLKLKNLVASLNSPNQVMIWEQDLDEIDTINQSLSSLVKENGIFIDNIIHVAGITKILPIRVFEIKKYKNIFDVNFFSAVEIIKSLIGKNNRDHLKNIILISSIFSKYGDKGNSIYAATKGAIDSFVKSMAVEVAPIKVNSILPGALNTNMTQDLFQSEQYQKHFNSKYLLGIGSVMNIASFVNYLIQEDTWITGQNIIIDGGATCH